MLVEDAALVAEADAAGTAMEQPRAQALFQAGDAFADGGPGQAQFLGRRGEALRVGHAHEGQQVSDVIQTGGGQRWIAHDSSLMFIESPTLSAGWKQ